MGIFLWIDTRTFGKHLWMFPICFFFFDLCQTKKDKKTLSHIKLRIYLAFNYYLEYHTNIAFKFQRISKSKKSCRKIFLQAFVLDNFWRHFGRFPLIQWVWFLGQLLTGNITSSHQRCSVKNVFLKMLKLLNCDAIQLLPFEKCLIYESATFYWRCKPLTSTVTKITLLHKHFSNNLKRCRTFLMNITSWWLLLKANPFCKHCGMVAS